MAVSDHPRGYQCEFIYSVPDDYYCKKCTLVVRRLTFTSCCENSYCYACIADTQQQAKPCPACGHQNFNIVELTKYQRRVEGLRVYCSMRGKGCGWSGMLGTLDVHMDPDQDNCQHVDTNCPLNCQQTIPKNKVEQHVAKECVKRDFICQFCAFKATYEEVVDTHLPECIYVPLQCPNLCGVTCERDVMEDHMRMCHLEEVACEFRGVGCDGRFIREDQEDHTMQNNQKHLSLTAAATVKINQQLQQKLQEQEQKLQEQEQKLQEQEQKLQEQEKKEVEKQKIDQKIVAQLEQKLQEQEQKWNEQKKKVQEQEQKIQEQDKKHQEYKQDLEQKLREQEEMLKKVLQEQEKKLNQNEVAVEELTNYISLKRTFTMTNFNKEKAKDKPGDWKSPAMYTHMCGYKFCIGIDANGQFGSRGKAVVVRLYAILGEYDYQLKWPAQACFTLELLNQKGRKNVKCVTEKESWKKPVSPITFAFSFKQTTVGSYYAFLEHSNLTDFLNNDTLYFKFTDITVY